MDQIRTANLTLAMTLDLSHFLHICGADLSSLKNMSVKLFIGGLSWSTSEESLRSAFEKFGDVEDAVVIKDRESGRSRGFGFVTFVESSSADDAISAMNDQELDGRRIRVDKAEGRRDRSPRTGGRGGFRGGFERRGGHRSSPYEGGRSYGGNGGGRYEDRAPRRYSRDEE